MFSNRLDRPSAVLRHFLDPERALRTQQQAGDESEASQCLGSSVDVASSQPLQKLHMVHVTEVAKRVSHIKLFITVHLGSALIFSPQRTTGHLAD